MKRFVITALTTGFAMMILAGVWHEVIMANFYAAETHATHEGTGIILIAYLILAVMMTFLFTRLRVHQNAYVAGLLFGCFIGVLWVFPHELAMAGAHGKSLSYAFNNALWHMVEQGLGGLLMGWMYRKTFDHDTVTEMSIS